MNYVSQLSLTRLYLNFYIDRVLLIKIQINQSLIPQIATASNRALCRNSQNEREEF